VVLVEDVPQVAGDQDASGAVALRRADPAVLRGAGDVERGAVPVDVAPFERERLADAQAGADQDLGERPVPVFASVEVAVGLLAGKVVHRRALVGQLERRVTVGVGGGICGDDAVAHGAAEDLAQRDQRVVDRLAREAAVGVEAGEVVLDVTARDLAQLASAEGRDEPQAQVRLVVAVGGAR
jgi:hypothetical protein